MTFILSFKHLTVIVYSTKHKKFKNTVVHNMQNSIKTCDNLCTELGRPVFQARSTLIGILLKPHVSQYPDIVCTVKPLWREDSKRGRLGVQIGWFKDGRLIRIKKYAFYYISRCCVLPCRPLCCIDRATITNYRASYETNNPILVLNISSVGHRN